jgi:hypothetical protein
MVPLGEDRKRGFPDPWIEDGRFADTDKSHMLGPVEIFSVSVCATAMIIAYVYPIATGLRGPRRRHCPAERGPA